MLTEEMEEALAERTAIMIVDGELSPEEARRGVCAKRVRDPEPRGALRARGDGKNRAGMT